MRMVPLKRHCKIISGAGLSHEALGHSDNEIPIYKVGALALANGQGKIAGAENAISMETAKKLGAIIVPYNTCLMVKFKAAVLMKCVAMTTNSACFDNNMMTIVSNIGVHPRYLFYIIQTIDLISLINPGFVPNLNMDFFRSIQVPFHSHEKQQKIASQLDHEPAEIDGLIADQQRLNRLREEWYTAKLECELIEKATEFIELRHLNLICSSGTSINGLPWSVDEGEFSVLKTGVVSHGSFGPAQNKLADEPLEILLLSTSVKAHTIIANPANNPEIMGSAIYVEQGYPNLYLPDKFWKILFTGISLRTLTLIIKTKYFREQVQQRTTGASGSMKNISFSKFQTLNVPQSAAIN